MFRMNRDVIKKEAIGRATHFGCADHYFLLTRDEIDGFGQGLGHRDLHANEFRSTETSMRDQLYEVRIKAPDEQVRNIACVVWVRALDFDLENHRALSGATAARSSFRSSMAE